MACNNSISELIYVQLLLFFLLLKKNKLLPITVAWSSFNFCADNFYTITEEEINYFWQFYKPDEKYFFCGDILQWKIIKENLFNKCNSFYFNIISFYSTEKDKYKNTASTKVNVIVHKIIKFKATMYFCIHNFIFSNNLCGMFSNNLYSMSSISVSEKTVSTYIIVKEQINYFWKLWKFNEKLCGFILVWKVT